MIWIPRLGSRTGPTRQANGQAVRSHQSGRLPPDSQERRWVEVPLVAARPQTKSDEEPSGCPPNGRPDPHLGATCDGRGRIGFHSPEHRKERFVRAEGGGSEHEVRHATNGTGERHRSVDGRPHRRTGLGCELKTTIAGAPTTIGSTEPIGHVSGNRHDGLRHEADSRRHYGDHDPPDSEVGGGEP